MPLRLILKLRALEKHGYDRGTPQLHLESVGKSGATSHV